MKWPAFVPRRQSQASPVLTTCSTWTRRSPEHEVACVRTEEAVSAIASLHYLLHVDSQRPRAQDDIRSRRCGHPRHRQSSLPAPDELSRAQENIRSGRCGHPRHRQSAPPAPPEAHRPSCEPGGIRRDAATRRRHHSDVQRAPRGTPRVEHRCRRARGHSSAERRDGARTTHDRRCPGISISMCTERPGCLAPHRTRTLHMEGVHQANSTGRQVAHPSGASMHREALQAFHVEQALGGGWAKALL